MNSSQTHTVPNISAPIRIQEYGVGIFMEVPTKSSLKKALKKEFLTVNGVVATTATILVGGEQIRLSIPKKNTSKRKLGLPLIVLYEDDYLAAIHKPAGILVSGNRPKTIVAALPQNLEPSSLPDATIPQPVHRLDYATTGILLVGKTGSSIRALNKLFKKKTIQKTYYAVVIRTIPCNGEITSTVDGKPSQSTYTVIQTVTSERFGSLNLVQLKPRTGRRHQLRKHLQSIGNPILGDATYSLENLVLKGKGLYLHAHSLEFRHPFTNKKLHIKDELPQKFKRIFSCS